jgi:hypothetical protein
MESEEVETMRRTELLQEIRMMRFEEAYDGWQEQRLTQQEAAQLLEVCDRTFRRCINDFNVKHFYSWYRRRHVGGRSYTWVKNTLQAQGVVKKASKRGAHRKKRPRSPYAGKMVFLSGPRQVGKTMLAKTFLAG